MSEAQPPARIQVGSQPAPTIIVANSVFLLLCKIFKGSDCVSFISLFPQNLAQSRSQPMHVNVKHLCRHQQANLAKKKRVKFRVNRTGEHCITSFIWQQRQMDGMEQEELQG